MGRIKDLLLKNKKLTIIMLVFTVVLVMTAVVLLIVTTQDDTYTMVMDAIEKTESKEDFILEFSSSSLITTDSVMQQVDSHGYISAVADFDEVFVHINTKSTSSPDSQNDFDVTASLYSDGEAVYEVINDKNTPLDMSVSEFNSIISEYGLYRYKKSDVLKVGFDENQNIDYEGSGDVIVTLKKPDREVLDSYAAKLSEITGEKAGADDLKVTKAEVVYSIYNDEVGAQTCNFAVEYKTRSGETIVYSSSAHVLYLEMQEEESVEYIDTDYETED